MSDLSGRSRVVLYGGSALLTVIGIVLAAVAGGITRIIGLGLLGVGVVCAISLAFLEVGLSEDREREDRKREPETHAGDRSPSGPAPSPGRRRPWRPPRRPE